jgi:hypothetical protein
VEGHHAPDNRYYLVDLQRLFPPEDSFKKAWGVVIPVDISEHIRLVSTDKEEGGRPSKQCITEMMGGQDVDWGIKSYPELIIVCYSHAQDSSPINSRASSLLSTTIRGTALVFSGERRETLYCHLRPELVKQSKFAVSSDAFMRFGKHDKELHEQEVSSLRAVLVDQVIPEFAKSLIESPQDVISAFHLTQLMHNHGINMRYLGLLYMKIPKHLKRLKYNVIGFQMLARVIKGLVQAKLRSERVESKQRCKEVCQLKIRG